MSLTTDSMSAADLAAITGNGRNNGFGYGGDGFLYYFMLFFFMLFGNNGWGNFGNNGNGGYGGGFNTLYPWMNQSQQTNDGFRDQMMFDSVNGIRDAVYGLGPQLCNGFNGVTAAVTGAQNALSQQMYANQIANMQQQFGFQGDVAQGFNAMQAQIAQYGSDARLASCQTQNVVQNEGNMTRFADANNTRDIIQAFNAGIQSVKDQLCDYRNAQKDETIANLRQELMFSRGQASQVEQTAQLLANNNAQTALFQQGLNNEVDALYNRLNNCPVGTVPVYGKTPIFNCNGNMSGCGCGCGA